MKKITGGLWMLLLTFSLSVWGEEVSDAEGSEVQPEPEQETQEIKYVTDKLRLSLYKRADPNSGTLKLLVSGDVLDVLERTGPYSKVRTREGNTGWVKNGFLVSTPPASFQLLEEQKKNEILARQLEQYADTKALVADYENTISKISEDAQTAGQELNETKQEIENLSKLNIELNEQIEVSQQGKLNLSDIIVLLKQFWYVVAIILLVFLLSGFIVGRQLVEAQVRRKFQGVKVW